MPICTGNLQRSSRVILHTDFGRIEGIVEKNYGSSIAVRVSNDVLEVFDINHIRRMQVVGFGAVAAYSMSVSKEDADFKALLAKMKAQES